MEGVKERHWLGIDGSSSEVNEVFEVLTNPLEHKLNSEFTHADDVVDRLAIETQAAELIANKHRTAPEYKTAQTYYDDARTLLFEALTASGHLSVVRTSGTLEQIHAQMLNILLNAYSENLPEHERRRRFQEICEELTIQAVELKIVAGLIPAETEVATISDYISEGTLSEKSAMAIGYRPFNKKGMVRSNRLIDNGDGTYTRCSKQVSRSNAKAERSQRFLNLKGIDVRSSEYADIAVLGTQFLHQEGVTTLMKLLDSHQDVDIQYGSRKSYNTVPYEKLEVISQRREEVAHCYVQKLADFTERLDRAKRNNQISEKQYQQQFKNEVGNILRAICVMDPSYAIDCFGEKAEAGFIKASNLAAVGNTLAALRVLEQNMALEQTVTFCGGSLSEEQAEKAGIQSSSLADLLKLGMEQFGTRQGACRVEDCPSPRPTEIGSCSVCVGEYSCQALFDKGWTYQRIRKYYKKIKKAIKKTPDFTTEKFKNTLKDSRILDVISQASSTIKARRKMYRE